VEKVNFPVSRASAPLYDPGVVIDVDAPDATIVRLLEARAHASPEAPCIVFEETALSNADVWEQSGRIAGGLAQLGVVRGTHVAIMLGNEPRFYLTWFALLRLGAIEVPVNTAFFGDALDHVLRDSEAELLVLGDIGFDAVAGLRELPPTLGRIVVMHPGMPDVPVPTTSFDELDADPPDIEIGPLDTAAILYTSGTTGASKGLVLGHRYFLLIGKFNALNMRLDEHDRYLTCVPLFHGLAQASGTIAPLLSGGAVVLARKFSVSAFWDICREQGVTAFGAIAAMTAMLHGAPASERDRDHRVRYSFAVAAPAELHEPFEERFGVRLVNGFGLTEGSMLTYCPYDDRRPGSAGIAVPGVEIEIHDESDLPVPAGEVGEIVARPLTHGMFAQGYLGRPEATLELWRNLWLHTGDLGKMDDEGFLYFVDRSKDAIRRRGENISSVEVEGAIAGHAGVGEVAAYAVPSSLGEDEVMIAVVPVDPQLSPAALHAYCKEVLPRFSVPSFIRFIAEMPYTPTNKIRKVQLREEGVTADTWRAD
jgi:crotonobetaine/carnitine-CoA ligase